MGTRGAIVQHAVVLAAGGSSRMGTAKALLVVDGAPLLVHHVRRFSALGLKVHVVVGAESGRVRAVLPAEVQVHVNPDWATTGPAESAWLALHDLGPAVVTPVDVPPAFEADLRLLLHTTGPAVLWYRELPGHPVRLDAPHPLMRLDERLRDAERIQVDDPGRVLNLNTPEEWRAWITNR